jgi:hypothetical protein
MLLIDLPRCNRAFVLEKSCDKAIATDDLNILVPLIKSLGFKEFTFL